jgi:hypothetical protein
MARALGVLWCARALFHTSAALRVKVTSIRLEMLGFAFTAQHSDARVLEQLLYKWHTARQVIVEGESALQVAHGAPTHRREKNAQPARACGVCVIMAFNSGGGQLFEARGQRMAADGEGGDPRRWAAPRRRLRGVHGKVKAK